MHPEMYLALQREVERERDGRLALRRPSAPPVAAPATPAWSMPALSRFARPASTVDDGARLPGRLARAVATVREAATPSTCCALA